jgi:hypothetical protein
VIFVHLLCLVWAKKSARRIVTVQKRLDWDSRP